MNGLRKRKKFSRLRKPFIHGVRRRRNSSLILFTHVTPVEFTPVRM